MPLADLLRLAVAVLVLVALACGVLAWTGRRTVPDALVAVLRAAAQLALVALVIGWIFAHPAAVVPYLAVMLVAAGVTSARRIGGGWAALPWLLVSIGTGPAVVLGVVLAAGALAPTGQEILLSIGTGPAVVLGVVLAAGALAPTGQEILPFTAQVIGGAMTAASLAGLRMRDDVAHRWGEVEAMLALGFTRRESVADLGRQAAARAVVPAIDQTRAAGLVTLPGAFVGLLLAGAEPWRAAQVQLLVLVGLLSAQSISAVGTAVLTAPLWAAARPVVAVR